MAPANNLERQAARRIAGAGNIKYTEALRRLRESGVQPSQILDGTVDAASIRNAPTENGTVFVDEAHRITETQASRDAIRRMTKDARSLPRNLYNTGDPTAPFSLLPQQPLDLDALRRAGMSQPDVRPALLPQEMFELGAYAEMLTADALKGQIKFFQDTAAQELLKIVLESQGEPSISLLGIPGSGKTFLLAKLSVAARAIPDVRVFTASGGDPATVAGLPEFLREAQSAQQTALVLLDNASGFGGTPATDPDHELGRAVAEQLILRGHPAAAVVAASHLPFAGETSDSDRVFMGWQHMRLPVAVGPEITAAGRADAGYTPLYVPAKGEARLLGDALAALTRMPSPQVREATAAMPVPAKPVDPLAKEDCPTDFIWSAFGANYPDTQCENGRLVDMDSGNISDIPCPFDNPEAFTGYQFGDLTIPECDRCGRVLPVGTEIHYHEGDYGSLWWSAACPDCGLQRVNMVDHSDTEGIEDIARAREDEQRRLANPMQEPSFTLGIDRFSGVPVRVELAGREWAHTAVVGEQATTTAELAAIAAELSRQGTAVTVFSGTPEQSWPEGVTVVPTGPGLWADARAVADRMDAECRAAMQEMVLASSGPADSRASVPLVILVDSPAWDAAATQESAEDEDDRVRLPLLWREWVGKARMNGWTIVQAMEPGATRGVKDMAWVLVPEASQVPWSDWPKGGRAIRDRRGRVRPVLA